MRRSDPYSTRTRTSRGTFMSAADARASDQACAPRATNTLLGLVGGAGIGAVLMYLLDPEKGHDRRHHLADASGRAAESAADAVAPVWAGAKLIGHSVADRAREWGESASSGLSSAASGAATGAASAGSFLSEKASGAGSGIRRGSRSAARSTRSWFGHEEEPSYIPGTAATVSAITALAAGVGIMYLLDPADGNRRRKLITDKCTRFANEIGDFFRKTGRHLANKSRGLQHEAASMVTSGEPPTDRQLAERIRATVGHYSLRANYDVLVDRGRVTLVGRCAPDDVNRLLGAVHAVPGVISIVNQLDVRADYDAGRSIYESGSAAGTPGTSTSTTGGPPAI